MPPDKAAAYVQEIRAKYRKNLTIDNHTGMINSTKNTQAMTEDFFFAKDDSGNSTTVEPFASGATFAGQLEDVYMFQKMVMDALVIPQARWKAEEVGQAAYNQGVEGSNLEEVAFQRMNRRLRKRFSDIILQVFLVHLKVRNYPSKFLDKALYNIDLNPATDFERMRDLAMAEKRGGVVNTLSQFLPTPTNIKGTDELGPLFSKQFFMEKILGMSTQEILLNSKMLDNEVRQMQEQAEAVAAEGGDKGDDAGGGDDLGF